MFTGIVRKTEKIKKVSLKNKSLFVEIFLPSGWKLKKGESVSINGICSTVKNVSKKSFLVEYMPETTSKTTALKWLAGLIINLEKSLKLSDLIDGHLVSGHVDTVGKIIRIDVMGDSKVITMEVPKDFMKYIAPKGSVAVDGISLTVVDAKDKRFTVSLVDYTITNTNFRDKKVGDLVNIETDIIAKYIFNILKNNTHAKKK